ncbi:MAG: hypothetical protein HRU30_19480 [Rhodobacteraceae bacterium]|nr:hypothetical protein [Paracoccaceae bacterium]
MSSSITDRESGIGVTLAKSKAATNRYLRLSGFPVTKQAMVRSFEDVKLFAETNGFPIVLKPTAEEQGRGGTTYIQSLDEAKKALTDLRKTYKHLLVEQHYHGDGYRVYVLDGKVVRVRKLSAAAVTGDGTSTIQHLINVENANPVRSAPDSALKKIVVDSTLKEMLSKQALDLEAVPDAGVKVVLSPTSNLSRGGTSVDFIDQLHPENRRLCEEISQTMCLVCSGVDMISVDASRPWHENGAVICEVNSQPQIGLKGRIHVHDMLIDGLGVKNTPISIEVHADATEYDAPLFDRSQDTLHLKVSAQRILQSGCPVQYFDTVTYADDVPEDMRAQVAAMLKSVPLEERAT